MIGIDDCGHFTNLIAPLTCPSKMFPKYEVKLGPSFVRKMLWHEGSDHVFRVMLNLSLSIKIALELLEKTDFCIGYHAIPLRSFHEMHSLVFSFYSTHCLECTFRAGQLLE